MLNSVFIICLFELGGRGCFDGLNGVDLILKKEKKCVSISLRKFFLFE